MLFTSTHQSVHTFQTTLQNMVFLHFHDNFLRNNYMLSFFIRLFNQSKFVALAVIFLRMKATLSALKTSINFVFFLMPLIIIKNTKISQKALRPFWIKIIQARRPIQYRINRNFESKGQCKCKFPHSQCLFTIFLFKVLPANQFYSN